MRRTNKEKIKEFYNVAQCVLYIGGIVAYDMKEDFKKTLVAQIFYMLCEVARHYSTLGLNTLKDIAIYVIKDLPPSPIKVLLGWKNNNKLKIATSKNLVDLKKDVESIENTLNKNKSKNQVPTLKLEENKIKIHNIKYSTDTKDSMFVLPKHLLPQDLTITKGEVLKVVGDAKEQEEIFIFD